MLVRIRALSSTARMILCVLLASLIVVTPLGAHARLAIAGGDFFPDLCTAAESGAMPSVPAAPVSHPGTHAQCGDCSTCGIAFAPSACPGISGVLIVATLVEATPSMTSPRSIVRGIVARPRGPPPLG